MVEFQIAGELIHYALTPCSRFKFAGYVFPNVPVKINKPGVDRLKCTLTCAFDECEHFAKCSLARRGNSRSSAASFNGAGNCLSSAETFLAGFRFAFHGARMTTQVTNSKSPESACGVSDAVGRTPLRPESSTAVARRWKVRSMEARAFWMSPS